MILRQIFLKLLLLFFPSCFLSGEIVFGLLVEGAPAVGKSTICQKLHEKLSEQRVVQLNHCFLSNHFLLKFVWDKAQESPSMTEESYYYMIGTILDLRLFRPESDVFYLQDRSWLSQECWIKYLYPHKQLGPSDFITRTHRAFQWNVYLYGSYEVIKDRLVNRGKTGTDQDVFFESEYNFEELHRLYLSKIPKNENWIIINTDYLTIDQIIEKIMNFINEYPAKNSRLG